MSVPVRQTESGNAFTALGQRARRTASRSLVVIEAAGLGCALAIWTWSPERWLLTLPFLALGAFGFWGVTDRMLRANRRRMDPIVEVILRSVRFATAAAGIACAATVLYFALGKAMGNI
jgi:hypothetical protein